MRTPGVIFRCLANNTVHFRELYICPGAAVADMLEMNKVGKVDKKREVLGEMNQPSTYFFMKSRRAARARSLRLLDALKSSCIQVFQRGRHWHARFAASMRTVRFLSSGRP